MGSKGISTNTANRECSPQFTRVQVVCKTHDKSDFLVRVVQRRAMEPAAVEQGFLETL